MGPGGAPLSASAAPFFAAAHGSIHGFAVDREETVPWFALSGAALAEGHLYGSLGWPARLMLLVDAPPARALRTGAVGATT